MERKIQPKCLNCDNRVSRLPNKFCCQKCQMDYQYKKFISDWLCGKNDGVVGNSQSSHIKRYLFEINDNKCEICGWHEINEYSNKSPLEIHHEDGRSLNNNISNLKLLCPNCHSLTGTYKNLNKKSDRLTRNK